MLAPSKTDDYYGHMTGPSSPDQTPEAALMQGMIDVATEVDVATELAEVRAKEERTKLLEEFSGPESESDLIIDEGVIETLRHLLPQIRRQAGDRIEQKRPSIIQARMVDTPRTFVGALLVASRAYGLPISGYHGRVSVTAFPDSEQAVLEQQYVPR